jgi:hypothetical protein
VPELPPPKPPQPRLRWIDLLLAALGMVSAAGLVLGAVVRTGLDARLGSQAIRLALWSLICGLAGYLLYGLGLPGTGFLAEIPAGLRGLVIGFAFGLLPLALVAFKLGAEWLSSRSVTSP